MSLKDHIVQDKLPQHIAIIMDGNGRWAKKRGRLRIFGHKNGVTSVREVTEACAELGVQYLTLYAFSKENWNRPEAEINALMRLLVESLHNEIDTLNKNDIRLTAIGDISTLPKNTFKELNKVIDETKHHKKMTLILALSYSSKWEIIKAVKDIVAKGYKPEQINEQLFDGFLETAGYPPPELLIRTSGELRISNFLLWQIAYSELYFTSTLWPDFRKEDLYKAIVEFQSRERRFGKTSEQITK